MTSQNPRTQWWQNPGKNPPSFPHTDTCLPIFNLFKYCRCGISASIFLFTSYNLFFSFTTMLWNKQAATVKRNQGKISHLLCTWAMDFESFVQQIVESSWISANWQLNFTFPECSGNISAWIFFSNTGARNKRFEGQCSKRLSHFISFNSHNNPERQEY